MVFKTCHLIILLWNKEIKKMKWWREGETGADRAGWWMAKEQNVWAGKAQVLRRRRLWSKCIYRWLIKFSDNSWNIDT